MVKDGEIVYPGTELIQSGELPPRKGMNFRLLLICSFFSFIVVLKMDFNFHTVTKLLFIITCLYDLQVLVF